MPRKKKSKIEEEEGAKKFYPPILHDYDAWKIPQLKEECRVRGLLISGTKGQFVSRLRGHDLGYVKAKKSPKEAANTTQAPKVQSRQGTFSESKGLDDMNSLVKPGTSADSTSSGDVRTVQKAGNKYSKWSQEELRAEIGMHGRGMQKMLIFTGVGDARGDFSEVLVAHDRGNEAYRTGGKEKRQDLLKKAVYEYTGLTDSQLVQELEGRGLTDIDTGVKDQRVKILRAYDYGVEVDKRSAEKKKAKEKRHEVRERQRQRRRDNDISDGDTDSDDIDKTSSEEEEQSDEESYEELQWFISLPVHTCPKCSQFTCCHCGERCRRSSVKKCAKECFPVTWCCTCRTPKAIRLKGDKIRGKMPADSCKSCTESECCHCGEEKRRPRMTCQGDYGCRNFDDTCVFCRWLCG